MDDFIIGENIFKYIDSIDNKQTLEPISEDMRFKKNIGWRSFN